MTPDPVDGDDAAAAYDHAPCALLSARPDGTIVKVNETLLTWTGYRRDDLLGRRLPELLPPGGRIYYETHVGPQLGMQGMVREIATELYLTLNTIKTHVSAIYRKLGASTRREAVRLTLGG